MDTRLVLKQNAEDERTQWLSESAPQASVPDTSRLKFSESPTRKVSGTRSPFLKWAGRKTSIINSIKELLPLKAGRFIEPFVGSGAVFLNTEYRTNLLADSNADVISLYTILKSDGEEFVKRCRKLFTPEHNQEDQFYKFRDEFNAATDLERRAELFIYLNRHCYNGLCRYNKSGKFNTPFGRYSNPYFPAIEMMEFAEKLSTAKLVAQDFRLTLAEATAGDVVYCDPPYVPLSATASFTTYAVGGFGPKDQEELVDCCLGASSRGATVLISNHDTPETRELYKDAKKIVSLLVQRMISCNGAERNKAEELIALFA